MAAGRSRISLGRAIEVIPAGGGPTLGGVEEIASAYTAVADLYVDLFGRAASVHPNDLDLIEKYLTLESEPVLDAGCGPGHLAAHLSSRGVNSIGVDITSAFIDHARRTAALERLAVGSLCHLPLRDGSVSGLLVWYSLIHLHPGDVASALTELRRVAAGGAVVVTAFFDGEVVEEFAQEVAPAFTWPIDQFSALMIDAGFSEIDRAQRPGDPSIGVRAHAALVAVAQ